MVDFIFLSIMHRSAGFLTFIPPPILNILRGEADTLSEREEVDAFCKTFHTHLTEMPGGEHHFHTVEQLAFFRSWLQEVLW